SDKWVQMIFTDPKRIILASTLKGWFFVGITSLLLYGLMRRCIGVNAAPKTFPTGPRRLGWPFIALMVVIVAYTCAGIFQVFIHREQEQVDQLQAVADLKIRQIVDGFLLAKVDAGTVSDALWIGFVGLLALFVTGVGFYLIRQGQQLAVAQAVQQSQAERLNALNLISSIADSSDDAIFAKDLAGRYILINRAASQFVGKSAEDMLGQDDRAIFTPEQAERLMTFNRRVITENRTMTQEGVLDTQEGERTFLTTKGPLRDNQANVIGTFGISRDITERKMAEAELIERNNELERFNRAMVGRELDMIALKQQGSTSFHSNLGRDGPIRWPFSTPDRHNRQGRMYHEQTSGSG
ncbi:MAG: PAS domain-containing protein, partial [Aquabacterium sp.]|nr:PAS domain-containing protein [Aquabacterium sp.]